MRNYLNLLVAIGLLTTGSAFAQATSSAAKTTAPAKSSSKQYVMDPKMHEQMMADAKKMDAQLQELKKAMADERAKGMDPAHHAEMMTQQRASDQEIEALQNTVKSLRQQLEAAPHYLDQSKREGTP